MATKTRAKPIQIGDKFERLRVVSKAESKNGTAWRCKCSCGGYKTVLSYNLTAGATRSCGCLQTEHRERQKASRQARELAPKPKKKPAPTTRKRERGKYEVRGELITLSEAVRRYGAVTRQTVYARLTAGWDVETALTTPPEYAKLGKGNTVTPPKEESKKVSSELKKEIRAAAAGMKTSLLAEYYGIKKSEINEILGGK